MIMTSKEIRQKFLDFFEARGHTVVPSAPMVVKNDSTLFCFGTGSEYSAKDVESAIDRFLAMAEDGDVNMRDYQRIVARYDGLSDSDKAEVDNYRSLTGMLVTVTL